MTEIEADTTIGATVDPVLVEPGDTDAHGVGPARAEGSVVGRIRLRYLLAPFVVAATASTIADWIWPSLATEHPLLLMGMSSKNRYLLLAAPQVGAISFFVVGFFRLIFTDPVTYLLGRQYGDDALGWVESKMGSKEGKESFVRKAERWFGKAAPVFIIVAPSALWCMLAGSARMKVWVFVACNTIGTVGRLALFWYAADSFETQLESMLDFVSRFQMPLLALTVGLGVIHMVRNRRKKGSVIDLEVDLDLI